MHVLKSWNWGKNVIKYHSNQLTFLLFVCADKLQQQYHVVAFRCFDGRDQRLNVENNSFYSNASAVAVQNFGRELNFPWCSHSNYHLLYVCSINLLQSTVLQTLPTFVLILPVSK